jgi:uncharacterized protein YdeI (YjbR/CyaY-like superfamily)
VDIGITFQPLDRTAWRNWLEQHHDGSQEIWLVTSKKSHSLTYLESVQEALCFGWIDGIAKRLDTDLSAQRFTPRRKKSHWTELNKERARRLIDQGLMTEAGRAKLPDLTLEPLQIAADIESALQSDPITWQNFQALPDVYQRIRLGYLEEMRHDKPEFEKRLRHFLERTKQNKWNISEFLNPPM